MPKEPHEDPLDLCEAKINPPISMGGATRRKQLKKQGWDNDDYCTPYAIKLWLGKLWRGRGIGLDPCSNTDSILKPQVEFMLPGRNGLELDWVAAIESFVAPMTVFVNPPYSRVTPWLMLASRLAAEHPDIQIVFLIPPVVASQCWLRWVWGLHDPTMTAAMASIPSRPATVVHMLGQPRLCFLKRGKPDKQPRGDSSLVMFAGERAEPRLVSSYILSPPPQGFRLRAVSPVGADRC